MCCAVWDPLTQAKERYQCQMFAASVSATHNNLKMFQKERDIAVWPPNKLYYAMPTSLRFDLKEECRRMQKCIDWLLTCFSQLENVGCPVAPRLAGSVHELQRIQANLRNICA